MFLKVLGCIGTGKGDTDFSLVVSEEKNGLRGIRAIIECPTGVTNSEGICNERGKLLSPSAPL